MVFTLLLVIGRVSSPFRGEHTSNWRKVSQHSDTYLDTFYSVSYFYLEFPKT